MVSYALATALLAIPVLRAPAAEPPDPDTDRDGLSDFQEVHKYGTDPSKKDSDGDGKPDGDAEERREYAYTVRSRVIVLRPVTPELLNDDFQDVRVLSQKDDRVELEVIHYPFSTANDAITGEAKWRERTKAMKEWLAPGPTSNSDAELGRSIEKDLLQKKIDVRTLDDKALVEQASRWLCERAQYQDGFTTFITGFKNGKPFVPGELRAVAERECEKTRMTLEEQWKAELFAKSMYELGRRGSCTSSAIYMCGTLRALGMPTRIVLCIPVVDASDPAQMEMVGKLSNHRVREMLLESLEKLKTSWSSHTFNEVWVGGRWRRLNYERLGQPTLDRNLYGLTTHVATLHDWADGKAWETIGRRQMADHVDAELPHRNPYRALELSDQFGAHAKVENPPVASVPSAYVLDRLLWMDAKELPDDVRAELGKRWELALLARADGSFDSGLLESFERKADLRFFLEADGHPRIASAAEIVTIRWGSDRACWIAIPLGTADRALLQKGVRYRLVARNDVAAHRWEVANDLEIVRGG